MDIFDIIGPVMIGPSSSHTAGALKIARICAKILDQRPVSAEIRLYGSFAKTYKGHGSDKAIVAGILGYSCEDENIRNSLAEADDSGLKYSFITMTERTEHPNTVHIKLEAVSGKTVSVLGESVGGGNIRIKALNDLRVDFTGQTYTLIIPHLDQPGAIAAVTNSLAGSGINISSMNVYRSSRGKEAVMIIETDQTVPEELIDKLRALPKISDITYIKP